MVASIFAGHDSVAGKVDARSNRMLIFIVQRSVARLTVRRAFKYLDEKRT